ncbi:MAG: J domain-containing protein [Sediminibacterium sp.]
MIDYYKVLNIKVDASENQIKKSFRKLAVIYHPDKNNGSKKSEEIFKVLIEAYEVLTNHEKRRKYDAIYWKQNNSSKGNTESFENEKKFHTSSSSNSTIFSNKQFEFNFANLLQTKLNFKFWLITILIGLLFIYQLFIKQSSNHESLNRQSNQQPIEQRPESGEINFTK